MGIAFRGVTGFATSFAKLFGVHKYLLECDKRAGSFWFCTSLLDPFLVVKASRLTRNDRSMLEMSP
jgi:hypothetical protein